MRFTKFKIVRKLKSVWSSKETYMLTGWALSRDVVAMVTSEILRLSYILKLRMNPIYIGYNNYKQRLLHTALAEAQIYCTLIDKK